VLLKVTHKKYLKGDDHSQRAEERQTAVLDSSKNAAGYSIKQLGVILTSTSPLAKHGDVLRERC
jgi:hypothetical protein